MFTFESVLMYIINWTKARMNIFLINFGLVLLGDFGMLNHSSKKNGYTLVEVLVVVSIMGILSSMGVASLRGAVINSRMKDCAINVTAFLERMANESNRLSKRLCVKRAPDTEQELQVYIADNCNNLENVELFATYNLESPARFGCSDVDLSVFGGTGAEDWAQNGAVFIPRIGLSAAPSNGYVCMQYGNSAVYGLVEKTKDNNMLIPWWRSGSYWDKL